MEIKLIKLDKDKYTLIYKEGDTSWEHNPELDGNLSLKNCQAIENGYDLMKLAEEYSHKYYDVKTTDWHCSYNGFFGGFQKALELLGDKKFSEEDVIYMIERSSKMNFTAKHLISNHKKTEWDVEIEMEEVYAPQSIVEIYPKNIIEIHSKNNNKPKLDADGCLILKRKV